MAMYKERMMAEQDNRMVLCGASKYTKKFYINPEFENLPDPIKRELKIMCVLFTEEIGGALELLFSEDGDVEIRTITNEDDYSYDDIGSEYKIRQMRKEKQELFQSLRLYYRVVKLGISAEQAAAELGRGFEEDDE
jgi:hypothetical protein